VRRVPWRVLTSGRQAHFLLGKLDACIDLLVASGRAPEAAFLARTYRPSAVSRIVEVREYSHGVP
jgi:coatomer subunit beta'